MHQRSEHKGQQIDKKCLIFETGQPVMVKNHAHHTFEPQYLLDNRVLKLPNDSIILLVMPNEKERKN